MVKRVTIATFLGFLCGLVCWQMAASDGHSLPQGIAASIILSRTLLGFAIGVSIIKMPWWLNGIVLGIIFSLPMAFSTLATPPAPGMPNVMMIFWGTIIMGVIYGFLIELITSVVFKARLARA